MSDEQLGGCIVPNPERVDRTMRSLGERVTRLEVKIALLEDAHRSNQTADLVWQRNEAQRQLTASQERIAELEAVAQRTVDVIEHLRTYSNVTPYIGDAVINGLETQLLRVLQP